MTRQFTKEENIEWQNGLASKRVAVGVILRDEQGRLLIVKQTYREKWTLAGGVVDEAESPLAAAVREVKEELGIELDPDKLALVAANYTPEMEHFKDFLSLIFDGGTLDQEQVDSIKLQEDELEGFKLVGDEDAKELMNDLKYRTVEAVQNDGPRFLVATKPLE